MPFTDKKGPIYIAGATAGVMGSLLAVEAIKFITGMGETLKNKAMFWDGLAMRFETIKLSKNPACKMCGKSA
jgi:adenylyltransferase/sulfurtransferase